MAGGVAALAGALVIFLGGASSYYRLPRLAVPDALRPAPACGQQEDQAQGPMTTSHSTPRFPYLSTQPPTSGNAVPT
ncbi:hypothetical protein D1007_23144 [Hordeum vulgare]|nr:hypothetical protein D1007_23144 [Hordeum vulgare]